MHTTTGSNHHKIALPRDRAWLRERVLVDGGALAIARGREWAEALGVECVITRRRAGTAGAGGHLVDVPRVFQPAHVEAQLVVVDAGAGHVRWRLHRALGPLLFARAAAGTGPILVAVDFGHPSESALELVARLARKKARAVTLVHSIAADIEEAERMANVGGSMGDFVTDEAREHRSAATKRLGQMLAQYDLRGDVRVGDAPAARLILSVARELQTDLIAVGASRLHGLAHLVRRSIVDEVALAAQASVLVVPHRRQLHVV
jgi:nucleotide-binding universal stress UspA family protein